MKVKLLELWFPSLSAHWGHLGKVFKKSDSNSIGLEWGLVWGAIACVRKLLLGCVIYTQKSAHPLPCVEASRGF
jgi:hypothetical protein